MITYSPAKINIGLKVLNKREDGFHNLHSYFYPVPLYDIIEVLESDNDQLEQTGFVSTGKMEENLVYKALLELRKLHPIPPVKIHLHKQIPFQAGLGGGSGDAISMIKLLCNQFQVSLREEQWQRVAEELGSDCPFFIKAQAAEVSGRGEMVKPVSLDLKGVFITIIKPEISIKTSGAFKNLILENQKLPPIEDLKPDDYQKELPNQFEDQLFRNNPELLNIKEKLIKCGAFYASLSGSGSALFGLSTSELKINLSSSYFIWQGQLK